jgi:dolichyl-phosphate-mannose--protein O-mannosyl transferase
MFLIAGIAVAKMLPKDKNMKIIGIPNRWFFAVFNSILFVIVEIILNSIGVLSWEFSWWQAGFPFILFLIGYMPFFIACYWVHDMDSIKKKLIAIGTIFGVDASAILIFGVILHWI